MAGYYVSAAHCLWPITTCNDIPHKGCPLFKSPLDQQSWKYPVCFFFSMVQEPLGSQDLLIIKSSQSHSAGLIWMSDQPNAETTTWWHATLTRDRHSCLGGIQTHNPSQQAAAHQCFKMHGEWYWPTCPITCSNPLMSINYPRLLQTPLLINERLPWLLCCFITYSHYSVTLLTNMPTTSVAGSTTNEGLLSLAGQLLHHITYNSLVKSELSFFVGTWHPHSKHT